MNKRRVIARGLLALVYIALAVFAFIYGREHKVFVENPSAAPMTFSVDGKKPVQVRVGGQRLQEAKGPEHRIRFEFQDGRAPLEARFSVLPFTDALLFSAAELSTGTAPKPITVPGTTEEH